MDAACRAPCESWAACTFLTQGGALPSSVGSLMSFLVRTCFLDGFWSELVETETEGDNGLLTLLNRRDLSFPCILGGVVVFFFLLLFFFAAGGGQLRRAVACSGGETKVWEKAFMDVSSARVAHA